MYNSLVQPHLDYCSAVWDGCCKGLSEKLLQELQNRAARIVTFSNYDTRSANLFDVLAWKKLSHQRIMNKAKLYMHQ